MLLASNIDGSVITINAAEESSNLNQTNQAIKAGNSLTQSQIQQANKYIRIQNNQYVLDISDNSCELSPEVIRKVQENLTVFNRTVKENGVILLSKDELENDDIDQSTSPFLTLAKSKKKRHSKSHGYIVGYGSNGYCYRDSKGNFHYYVTKSPLQTVLDVNRQGLEAALGGGWVQAPENAHWTGFKYNG